MTEPAKTPETDRTRQSASARGEGAKAEMPRHRAIYEELLAEIHAGVYKPGERLPSEAVLCDRFQASRITVARAIQTLQREHLVSRRPGSGTYVESPARQTSLQFGLLIPDLGTTDIFEPICQGIMRSPEAKWHSLTWGYSTGKESDPARAAEQLCQQYIAQKVAGVFFAPVEYAETRDEINHRIAMMLTNAGIPVVLLDRCLKRYPDRSHLDLVGIDNHQAGFVLTRHLIQTGAKRIAFAMRLNSAPTVEARVAGYRDALFRLQQGGPGCVMCGDFEDPQYVRDLLHREKPDGIVCANDVTAARLMRTLVALGVRIPADIKMVGLDDVNYARFLPTPLTTLRQDCQGIGALAMATMLDRIQRPDQPVKDVFVQTVLVIRSSCGSALRNEEDAPPE